MQGMKNYIRACPLALVCAAGVTHAQTVNVWPGVAPGSESWKQKEITIENTPVWPAYFA